MTPSFLPQPGQRGFQSREFNTLHSAELWGSFQCRQWGTWHCFLSELHVKTLPGRTEVPGQESRTVFSSNNSLQREARSLCTDGMHVHLQGKDFIMCWSFVCEVARYISFYYLS